jgi:hypothetical protein
MTLALDGVSCGYLVVMNRFGVNPALTVTFSAFFIVFPAKKGLRRVNKSLIGAVSYKLFIRNASCLTLSEAAGKCKATNCHFPPILPTTA